MYELAFTEQYIFNCLFTTDLMYLMIKNVTSWHSVACVK
jgi:hypothetical protein